MKKVKSTSRLRRKSKYKSKFESKTATYLKRHKVKFTYEKSKIPYVLACYYCPDWTIETPTGVVLVETKGYFKASDKRKMLAVKKQRPDLDIRLVFYRLVPEYVRWCEKNGFRYAIDKIPTDWLQGL